MFTNSSRPYPGDKSEGCFDCGSGKDNVLVSETVNGVSIARCVWHVGKPALHTQPFKSRQRYPDPPNVNR